MPSGDIRNWEYALQSRVNWGWLRFGTTAISVSDADFLVERRGHFLLGEIKPSVSAITKGQDILLRELAKLTCFSVFYLVGDIEDHEWHHGRMHVLGEPEGEWHRVDRAKFQGFINRWFAYANRFPPTQWRLWPLAPP